MGIAPVSPCREPSRMEEMANSLSHGIGLVATLVGGPILIAAAIRHGDAGFLFGSSVFALSMTVLYLASALYHGLPPGRAKRLFQILDHAAIFLLIAGTYTPFTLGVLSGAWGWSLLGLIWGFAVLGVVLKVCGRITHPVASTGLYLLMGWLILIAAAPLSARVPLPGLLWLVAGGVAYTAGVAFFVSHARLRYSHLIWHLFVMAGSACHYVAVLWYAA